MATFQWVSTRRLAQLTGDYDPEQLPHFNWTGAWGVEGVDLGANTDHEGALHFYFGDVPQPDRSWPPYDADLMAFARHPPKDPGQLVLEPVRSGDLFYPVTVTDQYTAPSGAHLATAHQVAGQLDVFYIGRDGALWVVWVNDRQLWHSPVPIAPSGIAPPGGGVAAAFQTG